MSQWTTADIPDQTGRTAIVTGSNTGLGLETAKALAAAGAHVVLAVRTIAKGREAAARIGGDVSVQELDLGSLSSVRHAADEISEKHERIDLLVNNAGVSATPKRTTSDGFELQFGTNHLGHFALTGLLLERMLPVPGSRVIVVGSLAHRSAKQIRFDDLGWRRGYSPAAAYGHSKLATMIFGYELQRRLRGQHTEALLAHPGIATTDLQRHLPRPAQALFSVLGRAMQSVPVGALATLRAATDPAALGGQYYGPDGTFEIAGHPQVVTSAEQSYDLRARRRLWTLSEELTGVTFPLAPHTIPATSTGS